MKEAWQSTFHRNSEIQLSIYCQILDQDPVLLCVSFLHGSRFCSLSSYSLWISLRNGLYLSLSIFLSLLLICRMLSIPRLLLILTTLCIFHSIQRCFCQHNFLTNHGFPMDLLVVESIKQNVILPPLPIFITWCLSTLGCEPWCFSRFLETTL